MQIVYVCSLKSMEIENAKMEIKKAEKDYFHLLTTEILNNNCQTIKSNWQKDWDKIDIIENIDYGLILDVLKYFNKQNNDQLKKFMMSVLDQYHYEPNILVGILVSLNIQWSHEKKKTYQVEVFPCLERIKLIADNITKQQDVQKYQVKILEQEKIIKKKQELCDQRDRYLQYFGGYGIVVTLALFCTFVWVKK